MQYTWPNVKSCEMIPESKGRCIERRVSDTRNPNEMDSEQKCFAIKHMEKWHIWFTRTKIKWKVYMRENSLTSTGPGVSTINDWDREKNNNGMILDTRRMFTMKNYSCSFLMRMKSRCDMALALSFALMPQPFGVCACAAWTVATARKIWTSFFYRCLLHMKH